jgi:prepilin-type N-terminal cleavage/methylation domain-containing protein
MKIKSTYLKVYLIKGDFWKTGGFWAFAFTLVELIVVITILAILSTIWFVAYNSYLTWARDSNRVWQLASISDWIEIYRTNNDIPLPENSVEIRANWAVVAYQWYMWKNNLETIAYSKWWIDPKDDTYYSYLVTSDLKNFQLMAYLEDSANKQTVNKKWLLNKINAVNYAKRYPTVYGKKLWILTESWTNTPVQEVSSIKTAWNIDIVTTTWNYIANYTDKTSLSWTGLYLSALVQTMSDTYKAPIKCPAWFIWVPWDINFNQAWFCVAQYEMSYSDADIPNSCDWTCPGSPVNNISWPTYWTDWNTVWYVSWKTPVSTSWKYPIADITQQQAIDSCKNMWAWYHLITNNEWMAISRNIELQWVNWSWWQPWKWYIYNGVSNDTNLWCNGKWWNTETRNWVTKTWVWESTCNTKRQLKLSNWQVIWDLAWNVREHVNGANTIDWVNYNTMNANVCWTAWASDWSWYSYTSWWSDTEPQCSFMNWYTYWKIWPQIWWLNSWNGIWRIYSYKINNTTTDRVFLRGGDAQNGDYTGLFTIHLTWHSTNANRAVGFRCSL